MTEINIARVDQRSHYVAISICSSRHGKFSSDKYYRKAGVLDFTQQKKLSYENLLVWTNGHIKCGKYVRLSAIFFGDAKATQNCFCASLLSNVITGATNFERLTNICSGVIYLGHIG